MTMICKFHSEYQEVWYRHTLPKNSAINLIYGTVKQTNKKQCMVIMACINKCRNMSR